MAAEHLLLLPGMMCDARLWQHQVAEIGLPTSVADMTGSSDFRALAAAILDRAPARFAVAGLSMGGIVAFELWRQAPERISHLALLDTTPYADAPDRRELRLRQIEQVLDGGLREIATESLKPLYLARAHRDDERLLQTILDMALDLGPDVFRDQSLALRKRPDSVGDLASIDVPTTVICGAEDQLCPVAWHEFMAERIVDAELIVIPECGHLSPMESPNIVTAALRDLLKKETLREMTIAS